MPCLADIAKKHSLPLHIADQYAVPVSSDMPRPTLSDGISTS